MVGRCMHSMFCHENRRHWLAWCLGRCQGCLACLGCLTARDRSNKSVRATVCEQPEAPQCYFFFCFSIYSFIYLQLSQTLIQEEFFFRITVQLNFKTVT